ncbi:T9SS type A sorting domain-containing protein [candidate division WOR-3 bacterium]|uniref:T9SS type A sorting domain-containing protein n=1 Tax=candidate division WOR-3 bacterium TaxID=2052148 RepID=A0A938BSX2_UNCW3|nr:T9SS type A sorting domain-containing protein [candidate division WOR-3 bacterium]
MSLIRILPLALATWTAALGLPKVVLPAHQTGPMTINLVQGYSFDPLEKSPVLPQNLTAADFSGDYSYCMIQFPGPIRPEWKRTVEGYGAELLWYVPRYTFVARVPTAAMGAIAALPEVRWLGIDQPAFKLCPGLEKATGRQTLIVVFHYQESEQNLLAELDALGAANLVTEFNAWNKSVKMDVDATQIPAIARLNGVYWVEPYTPMTPDNMDTQWVDQHGYSASDTTRTIWRKGVYGRGMLVGLTDGPMNIAHNQFRDTVSNTPGPNHRKVVAYRGSNGSDSHGTHTTGTLCGSDDEVGGTSWNDGLAKGARVFFQNFNSLPSNWDMTVFFRGPDSGLDVHVDSLRALNNSMSYSRKDSFNQYVFTDMTADQFTWNHRKFMHCNSMGNRGVNEMGHPVNAKNIISTGGTGPGTSCRQIFSSSSRGPTSDGRRKPQLVSPAEDIMSADNSNPNGYVLMSGTSMSTPNMAGAMALIRNYFQLGYYPTGDTLTGTRMGISAALNKAVGIVGADNDIAGYTVPDNNVGWGRVDLDSSLYFAGDTSRLWVLDDTIGLETGDSVVIPIDVTAAGKPFRVTLCWTDYPGTMRSSYVCVNDINLTVYSPSGTPYKGNVYSGGQSATGGINDSLNVEECTRINSPEVGSWSVVVKARNVPQGPQPFALAAIGVMGDVEFHDVTATFITAPTDTVDSGTVVAPAAEVRNFGTFAETLDVWFTIGSGYSDSVRLTLGVGGVDTVSFADWAADTLGNFAVTCSTGLAGDANTGNNVVRESVVVRSTNGIEEGRGLPRVFSLDRAAPNPFGRSTAIRYAIPRATSSRLSVYSATGALVRTLQEGELKPGYYSAAWNGRDGLGRLVPSGIYLYRLEAGQNSATGKVLLSR